MHFTRHFRSKHPDGSFRLGRVMVPPDRCCSACSVAVRRSFNPTKRRSSVCSAAVRLFLAWLVQRQPCGSFRKEVVHELAALRLAAPVTATAVKLGL